MNDGASIAKTQLRALLEALGHKFGKCAYSKVSSPRICYQIECKECGATWHLRFSAEYGTGATKITPDFPKLGGRCERRPSQRDDRLFQPTTLLA